MAEKVTDKLGRPTVLSDEEERILVERLIVMGEWGFPLTSHNLRHLIKAYLDRMGKTTRNVHKRTVITPI